jgi:hypothetical protein
LLKSLNLPRLGWPLRTFVLATRTLLFAAQEGPVGPEQIIEGHLEAHYEIREATLRAYDKAKGDLIAEIPLPANATGSLPITALETTRFSIRSPHFAGSNKISRRLVATRRTLLYSVNRPAPSILECCW